MKDEQVVKTVKKWKTPPYHLDGFMELLADFQSSIFREMDSQKFSRDFISYALMENTLYNITEENYYDEHKTDEVFKSLAKALEGAYNGSKENHLKLPDTYVHFFEELKKTVKDYPLYSKEIILKEYDNLRVKLIDPYRNKNRVSSEKSIFLIDTDALFSNPESSKKLLEKVDETISSLDKFDKFCFIEKRKGPIGPSVLMAHLTSTHGKEAVIYRPKHLTPLARIGGNKIKKGDELCLVYDLSFSGYGLEEAALELKRGFSAEPKYAVVIADVGNEAKDKLKKIGVTLKPVYKLPKNKIRQIYKKEFGINIEDKPIISNS